MDTAVAEYDQSFAAFQAQASSMQGEGKAILKFVKGRYILGQDMEIVEDGTEFLANIMEAETGWIFWRNGKPEERQMVRIATGLRSKMRADLGHLDEQLWELDKESKPIDPWAKTYEIPCREISGDEREITLAGGSKGFETAAKKLFEVFSVQGRVNRGKVPVITCGISSGSMSISPARAMVTRSPMVPGSRRLPSRTSLES
ncbi:MAG: hypothetical protein ACR2QF_05710, partial [Geminicoccaceae bacterium]